MPRSQIITSATSFSACVQPIASRRGLIAARRVVEELRQRGVVQRRAGGQVPDGGDGRLGAVAELGDGLSAVGGEVDLLLVQQRQRPRGGHADLGHGVEDVHGRLGLASLSRAMPAIFSMAWMLSSKLRITHSSTSQAIAVSRSARIAAICSSMAGRCEGSGTKNLQAAH
ncbi:hypothetical protein [Nonomuraea sp. NPDC049709]|uniref:hypothetical protein n=1 Tax=Nonomuraea sp. NPDC049709 TaxID=3154736 RepID=UPI0034307AF4